MAYIETRKTKKGEVRYRALVRLKGAPAESATFKRKTDAKKWVQKTETAIRERRHFKTREATRRTFAELVDRYCADILSSRPEGRRADQKRHLGWWRERLGPYVLADVTPSLITRHRDELARGKTVRKRRRSEATVNRYLASLSHAFTVASREWEWIEANPVRKVSRLREPRGRVRFLLDDERGRLLEACQASDDPRLYLIVLLAISTGARRGELLQLRWQDVDLVRGVAVVHHTKNRERRALPLAGPALEQVREANRVRRIGTDHLFADARGRVLFPRQAWEGAVAAAKIEDFRFHDLRHSAASYLAMSGATLAEIAEILGHKTLAMVKRYSHLTEQHTSKVVARMNEQIFGASGD